MEPELKNPMIWTIVLFLAGVFALVQEGTAWDFAAAICLFGAGLWFSEFVEQAVASR